VALSCTHVGISSLRIEGAWMVIGQGAGIAAALAAKQGVAVQDLPYPILRERLLAQGQALKLPVPRPAATAQEGATTPAKSLPGIVLDDSQAELAGGWTRFGNFKPYIGPVNLSAEGETVIRIHSHPTGIAVGRVKTGWR